MKDVVGEGSDHFIAPISQLVQLGNGTGAERVAAVRIVHVSIEDPVRNRVRLVFNEAHEARMSLKGALLRTIVRSNRCSAVTTTYHKDCAKAGENCRREVIRKDE